MWLSQMLSTVPTLAPSQLPCGVTCVSIRSRMPISMMMPSSSGRLLTCSLVMVWCGGVMPQAYHSTARTWHPKYANHKFQTKQQSSICRAGIVDTISVGDQTLLIAAQIEERIPVRAVTGQARDVEGQEDANLAQSDLG